MNKASLKLIAQGRISDVYLRRQDEVVKLYHPTWPIKNIKTEQDKTKLLYEAGLPVPRVKGIESFDGRTGLVFEYIDGDSLLGILQKKPWKFYDLFSLLCRQHKRIHAYKLPSLPSQSRILSEFIENSSEVSKVNKNKLIGFLNELSNDSVVCHGDFQPGNVLISKRGAVIIDWFNATSGSPLCDVARSFLSISIGAPPQNASWLSLRIRDIGRSLLHPEKVYLRAYFENSQYSQSDLNKWILIVAAARLGEAESNNENLGEEKEKLSKIIQNIYP